MKTRRLKRRSELLTPGESPGKPINDGNIWSWPTYLVNNKTKRFKKGRGPRANLFDEWVERANSNSMCELLRKDLRSGAPNLMKPGDPSLTGKEGNKQDLSSIQDF